MSVPAVSVVIASYNHRPWIVESIQSVLAQRGLDFELIVIDDGSSDGSEQVIAPLAAEHQFHFEQQPNMGLARTLNKALGLARGRYFAPFGSDDRMRPGRLALQQAHLDNHLELVISAGNIFKIDEHGQPLAAKKQRHYPARELDFADVFLNRKPGAPAPTLLFRTEALRRVGGFNPEIRLEDLYIELKLTESGGRIGILEDVLADYRIHGKNTYQNLRFMYENVSRTYSAFSQHPEYSQARAAFLNSMLRKAMKRDRGVAKTVLADLGWKQLDYRNWLSALSLLLR
ncbi:MAG TPA: glycosyltransferase [Permianibacter sp.]|nr:glycosyltransferase [Permianibacter sp.]